ncbi:NAD(P)H-dependent oxidoreductase subunit E [Desulfobulbus oligotrophicus]|uniref:NAD(P)H-dependent oxidoreductase subunit E n=1 Tax=Desulfobulbus oligotrophicus TaxID=1909699 RepID=A0A7T5VF08_9BACT|nr:NAD(P)H-dependent oxidoreductase subunit E [Desulfobulbus oligotrophicus]QQG66572.1 NAD(P)H-dependent oxidoreductase subunit E [Desulfobulbus oligotrophicus]
MPTVTRQPIDDRRWQRIVQTMQRHNNRPDALIETLHTVQDIYGYLDSTILSAVANHLKIPPARVFGVATFYNHFSLKPKGDHTLVICTGTACHVKGNDQVLAWMHEHHHLAPGETSADNRLSLVEARCVGACALAPVILCDGVLTGRKTFEETTMVIEEWLGNAS